MSSVLIKNAELRGKKTDISIADGRIEKVAAGITGAFDQTVDASGLVVLPAFVDLHVHLREPGFEGKEDILSGTKAAVNGGFASVCCMPNTKPAADNPYIIKYIVEAARAAGYARVFPIGAITKAQSGGELAEMGKMKKAGAVAVSDDGFPVENANMMRLAMEYAKGFGLPVVSHCEDMSLSDGGAMNEGLTSTKLGIKGITRASEEVMVAREIILADTLNTHVHIAHVSTKGSVRLIRDAKAAGIRVTAETCPHYFAATDALVEGYDTNAKVNPPLRTEEDRLAIIEGLVDGTIDAIVTDHAPHKQTDKCVEFCDAANGISGLETAYALSYTYLVKTGILTLEGLSKLMSDAPAGIFGLPCGKVEEGGLADLVLVDNRKAYKIDRAAFLSKGKNTPFHGWDVFGKVVATMVDGVFKKENGVVL